MGFKKFIKNIPRLPLSALIFYIFILLLWNLNIIPSPTGILAFLEGLYNNYGLIGLFISSFLEGIVYLGLYFPGSFIIALSVILSDGSFKQLATISLIVALTLTITSLINYFLGRRINFLENKKEEITRKNMASRGLLVSILHPNILAFYFFNSGLRRRNPWKIIVVPILMFPYGLLLAYLFSYFREGTRRAIESPYIMITLILVWIVVAFYFEHHRKRIFVSQKPL